MLPEDRIAEVLGTIEPLILHGPWYRAVFHEYLTQAPPGEAPETGPQPLWSGGPAKFGGRFTPISTMRTVYLAIDAVTALEEVARPAPLRRPLVLMEIDGFVAQILDLADETIQEKLSTSHAELTGDWTYFQQRGALAPTQWLARAAFDAGWMGLRYRSARRPLDGFCLAIFEERLRAHGLCYLEALDPAGHLAQRIPERA